MCFKHTYIYVIHVLLHIDIVSAFRLLKLALLRNTVRVPVEIYLLLAFPTLSLSTI